MAKDTPWKCKRCQTTGQIEDTCDSCGSPPDWVPTPPPRNAPTPEQEEAERQARLEEQRKAEAEDIESRARAEEVKALTKKKWDDTVKAKVEQPVNEVKAEIDRILAKMQRQDLRIDALENDKALREGIAANNKK